MSAIIRVVAVVVFLGIASLAGAQTACGSIDLTSEPNASKYVNCETADYVYALDSKVLTSVSLPHLTSVGGINFGANDALQTIDLSALKTTQYLAVASSKLVTSVSLPHLTSVGEIHIQENNGLTLVSLPLLSEVTSKQGIQIVGNVALQTIDLGALQTTPALNLYLNSALTALALDSLANVDGVLDFSSCRVPVLSLPRLTSAGQFGFYSNSVTVAIFTPLLYRVNKALLIYSNDLLQAVAFPNLQTVSGSLLFHHNAVLKTIAMPALTSTQAVDIYNQPALAAVALPKLATIADHLNLHDNSQSESIDLHSLTTCPSFTYQDAGAIVSCRTWPVAANVICPKACGAIDLSQADASTFASCGSASSLTATNTASPKGLRLLALTSVSGNIVVSNTALQTLALPLLATAGEIVIESNHALQTLDVSSLTDAHRVALSDNGLPSLSMPMLATVTGAVRIVNSASIASVSLPNLRTAGELSVMSAATSSAPLAFPSLQTITTSDGLTISGTGTRLISAPWLTSIGGGLVVENNSNAPYVNLLRLKTAASYTLRDYSYLLSCQPTLVLNYGAVCPKASGAAAAHDQRLH